MRATRMYLAGMVILALLAGLPGGVLAEDEDEDEDQSATATYVTGTITQVQGSGDFEWSEEGGVGHGRGMLNEQTIEWSDPRLPSRLLIDTSLDEHNPDARATASSYRLEEGPDGAWVGTGRGYFGFVLPEGCDYAPECQLGPGDGPKIAGLMTLAGEGVYEGLSVMISSTFEDGTPAFEGYIFEGALPPMPEPVDPSSARYAE